MDDDNELLCIPLAGVDFDLGILLVVLAASGLCCSEVVLAAVFGAAVGLGDLALVVAEPGVSLVPDADAPVVDTAVAGRVPEVADPPDGGVDLETAGDVVFLADTDAAGPPAGLAFGATVVDLWAVGLDFVPSTAAEADDGLVIPDFGVGFLTASTAVSAWTTPASDLSGTGVLTVVTSSDVASGVDTTCS